ncbi:glycosyltransferase family 4 protein [cf. Phormidesmis sp. LEGE 11477]|uniref:glycosyltransferase family 4 protein n=1 Tax=cf. Phormidesmis sp. LEGE 11477 TaxID=1828680 RepID=UPI00187EB294|nr:glycosyltransferase family 4 protein [cf. Phormidesmis sp. LEGE 11477]MBE9062857.1 glycosyltransferase family 4 protein [cf. Phormidesmis sp. LEGE 11477]
MRLGIYSTVNGLPWGASEYLWSQTALRLQQQGHTIGVNYQWFPDTPPPLAKIQAQGGSIFWRNRPGPEPIRLSRRFTDKVLQFGQRYHDLWLRQFAPDFVLISISYHTDDVSIANACLRYGIPFATLLHCASTADWITTRHLETCRNAYTQANRSFFVSKANHAIMERLLAAKIPQARTVHNPLKVAASPLPWSEPDPVWQLACVGRIHFRSKGQDLVLQVLRQQQWRDRPLRVVFWGKDQGNQRQLEDLANWYGVRHQIQFGGYVQSPADIWAQSHGLLLPSRFEGMPIVTAEAMLCGRITIVTDCGCNSEWVDEGETGFLAAAPTVDDLDAALERAWQHRQDWQAMGMLAAKRLRQHYSPDPIAEFIIELDKLYPLKPSP